MAEENKEPASAIINTSEESKRAFYVEARCRFCNEMPARKRDLPRHEEACRLRDCSCFFCRKLCSPAEFIKHQPACTSNSDNFRCLVCKETYTRIDNCKRHEKDCKGPRQ